MERFEELFPKPTELEWHHASIFSAGDLWKIRKDVWEAALSESAGPIREYDPVLGGTRLVYRSEADSRSAPDTALREAAKKALIPLAALIVSGECTQAITALAPEVKAAVIEAHEALLSVLAESPLESAPDQEGANGWIEKCADEMCLLIDAKPELYRDSFIQLISRYAKLSYPEGRDDLREALAKALWDSEIAEAVFKGDSSIKKVEDAARWPKDSKIQPYCRSTYRQADFILAALCGKAKLPAPEGMGRDAEKFELRHHTCEFASNFPDPPIMEEEPYDGTLSDEKGTWRKFMCPICHDRIVIQFLAHPTSESGRVEEQR